MKTPRRPKRPQLGIRFTHDDGSTAIIVELTDDGWFGTETTRPDGRTIHNRFRVENWKGFLASNKAKGWKVVEQ
jgi:hypothetical protein